MPKEAIRGDLPLGEEGQAQSIVEVRWDRTGYFQIVTKAVDRVTGGRLVEDEETHYTDGMYVGLERREINALIRVLRRARDQAFGRDE